MSKAAKTSWLVGVNMFMLSTFLLVISRMPRPRVGVFHCHPEEIFWSKCLVYFSSAHRLAGSDRA